MESFGRQEKMYLANKFYKLIPGVPVMMAGQVNAVHAFSHVHIKTATKSQKNQLKNDLKTS